ncbi:hypothetical protein IWX90DRAFT_432040 [Phyllosticta citrichinensis]|uniref:Uncharacterized protein n=1 Tax=Phyllosticta citrichinensis TaxID=1130410 RepID=A0ABR1XXX5_9PEZI
MLATMASPTPTPSKRRTDVLHHPKDDVFDDSNVAEPGQRDQSPASEIPDSHPDGETLVDERTHALSGAPVFRPGMRDAGDQSEYERLYQEHLRVLDELATPHMRDAGDQSEYERLYQEHLRVLDELATNNQLDIQKDREVDDLYILNANLRKDLKKAKAKSVPAIKAQISTLASGEQVSQLTQKVDSLIYKLDTMADKVAWLTHKVEALHAMDDVPEDVKGKGPANMTLRKHPSSATLPTKASLAKLTFRSAKHASPYLVTGGASKSVGDLFGSPAMSTLSLHKQPTRTNSPIRPPSPDKGLVQHGTSPGKPSLTSQGSPTTPSSQRSRFGPLKKIRKRVTSIGRRGKGPGTGEGRA